MIQQLQDFSERIFFPFIPTVISLKQKNLHELNEFQILDFDYYLHHYYYYYILYILLYLLIYITLQIDFAIFSFYVSIV